MKSNELKILNAFGHSLIRCERISGLNSVISRILRILSKIKNKTKKIESKCRLFVATHFIHFENCIRLTGTAVLRYLLCKKNEPELSLHFLVTSYDGQGHVYKRKIIRGADLEKTYI